MKGYVGKIVQVDLTRNKSKIQALNRNYAKLYLGGRGLGARYLFDIVDAHTDPLSPENTLIIMTSPLTGTPAFSVHKFEVVGKSPLTNFYFCSNVGGTFGVELKRAGFDGIIIHGRSQKPSYVWISDGKIEVRDATPFWGKRADETRRALKEEVGDERANVMRIGTAGERLVRFANIMSEPDRSAGRCGAGAVMGSKNLKAMVVRGTGGVEIADRDGLREYVKEIARITRENPLTGKDYPRYGTQGLTKTISDFGILPFKNFQAACLDVVGRIDPETWRQRFVVRDTAPCYICPVACGKISEVKDGRYRGARVEGPEYETLWAFGPQCGILELEPIIAANMLCDQLGLDTISTGNVIGFAMECYERGLITKRDANGIELNFGNDEALLEVIPLIGERKGIGNILANGVKLVAEKIGRGAENFAMHVKGLELPAYDPRGVWGMGLAYATACRGGDHLKAWTISDELISGKYDPFSTMGKKELVFRIQNIRSVIDSLLNCILASRAITIETSAKLMTLITGEEHTERSLLRAGERIYNVERCLAVRDGISRKDDVLPPRIIEEPLSEGRAAGRTIGWKNFELMIDEYYAIRGWDKEGIPTEAKLKELDMEDIAQKMRGTGG